MFIKDVYHTKKIFIPKLYKKNQTYEKQKLQASGEKNGMSRSKSRTVNLYLVVDIYDSVLQDNVNRNYNR